MFSHLKRWYEEDAILPFVDLKDHPFGMKDMLIAVIVVALTTVLGLMFHIAGFSDVTIITLYILAVQIIAIQVSGLFSNAVISLVCVIAFNFFFTDPKYTLLAYDPDYPVTFVVMFFVAFLAGSIANRLKNILSQSERTLLRTQVLLDTSQLLSKTHEKEEIVEIIGMQIHRMLERDVEVVLKGEDGNDTYWYFPKSCERAFASEIDTDAVNWTLCSAKKSGARESAYPGTQAVYYPIVQNERIYGAIGIQMGNATLDHFSETMVQSILNQCGLAMENVRTVKEKEQEALKAQNEKLRADLLRAISHDLRTPLTAISGNASILMSSEASFDDTTRKQLYSDIYDDSIWLVNLVENLLAVSRAINGTMQLRCTSELLNDVVDEALKHVDRHVGEHELNFESSSDVLLAKMDVHLIEQVVINLVNNAIKYTPQGSNIKVATRKAGRMAVVTVSDDGPGIAKEDLPHVFEMFYNGRKNASDASKSLGIGLALCKSIVEAHDGTISVTNVRPHGASFRFSIPIQEVELNEP